MSSDKKHTAPLVAAGSVTGILAARTAVIHHFGGPAASGFHPSPLSLLNPINSTARAAFRAAPLPIKVATGVALVAGVAAQRPLQAVSHLTELARSKANDWWKSK